MDRGYCGDRQSRWHNVWRAVATASVRLDVMYFLLFVVSLLGFWISVWSISWIGALFFMPLSSGFALGYVYSDWLGGE